MGESGMILHYEGRGWWPQASRINERLYAVWGSGPTDVYAVGAHCAIAHYDGSSWRNATPYLPPSFDLKAVWGTEANHVFAVGDGGLILHFDGEGWRQQTSNTSSSLYAVWGLSNKQVYAVGSGGTVLHYDGSIWQATAVQPQGPLPWPTGDYELRGVWGTSRSDVHVLGTQMAYQQVSDDEAIQTQVNVASHYNGRVWEFEGTSLEQFPPVKAVCVLSPTAVYALGFRGPVLRFDGAEWESLSVPTGVDLLGLWVSPSEEIFVAGSPGTILHHAP